MSTGERVCWTFTLVGAAMTAAPFVAGETLEPIMGDGMFAMMFFGAVMGLTCFICVFVFRKRGKHRERLLRGTQLLANWSYTEEDWRVFAGQEYQRQAEGKRALLWILAIMLGIAAGVVFLIDSEAGVPVGIVLFGVFILCWLASRLALRAHKKREQAKQLPSVRIDADALLLGNELHIWHGCGGRLEGCSLHEGPPMQLEIDYSTPGGKSSRAHVSVRVPVPFGREEEAAAILQKIKDRASEK